MCDPSPDDVSCNAVDDALDDAPATMDGTCINIQVTWDLSASGCGDISVLLSWPIQYVSGIAAYRQSNNILNVDVVGNPQAG